MKWVWLRMIASVTRDLNSINLRSHKDAVVHSDTSDLPDCNSYLLAMPIDFQVSVD